MVNSENHTQLWKIWDSGYDEDEMGTCDEHPSPVGFEIIRSPSDLDSKSDAFYGMTYQGGFIISIFLIPNFRGPLRSLRINFKLFRFRI